MKLFVDRLFETCLCILFVAFVSMVVFLCMHVGWIAATIAWIVILAMFVATASVVWKFVRWLFVEPFQKG